MAIKKSQLYSYLWACCDELRGGMDASQYKDYVLTLLFMKFVSDKAKSDPYSMIIVPKGCSFDDMLALKNKKNIGEEINKIISELAKENKLAGVIDVADFNDEQKLGKGQQMVDRLSKLVSLFQTLDLTSNRADGDDLLGDAYEYLMSNFATESGKSKGQFYTPSEVSRILAQVVGINSKTSQDETCYDPTCGSASLLLKASAFAPNGLSLYGQEMDVTTAALAKMNLILHGQAEDAFDSIMTGNTIADPAFLDEEDNSRLKTFDFAVANPPFSNKNWTTGIKPEADMFKRFENDNIPPEKNGDYAFLLHILKSLKSTGKGAVILPHGVLFRGNAEARIRQHLIKQGYIKGLIGLPANLFFGTGIPACIIVVDKENATNAKVDVKENVFIGRDIFMIDASKGFMKDGNKNRLRSQDVHKIVDVFNKEQEIAGYSRKIPFKEILDNDYNLNIPRYIESGDTEDIQDLKAHLIGGIPNRDIDALDKYWQVFPTMRETLFENSNNGYSKALISAAAVKKTVSEHPEFTTFFADSLKPFKAWFTDENFKDINKNDKPKELIFNASERLLAAFADAKLLSRYDVYQILMDYWADIMQDDVYVITQDGWKPKDLLREIIATDNKLKETADFVLNKKKYVVDLIKPPLVINRFLQTEQELVDTKQSQFDSAAQALEEFVENNTAEDGLLNEAINDKGNVTKPLITARLKEAISTEEKQALTEAKTLIEREAAAKTALKDAQEALLKALKQKYDTLTEDEIKTLVVEDKWQADLQTNLEAEIERVTQQMATRVKELEERYAESLKIITQSVQEKNKKVEAHLKLMGLEVEL